MNKPVVIGIDPGSHSAGIAVTEGHEVLYSNTIDSLTNAKWDDNDLGDLMVEFMLAVQEAIETYKPELMVVELTSVPNNMHTNKLLAYWEAAAIIAGSMSGIFIKRMRTKEARKLALGKGDMKKESAINMVCDFFNIRYPDDEAEAIMFAWAGVESLKKANINGG